MFEWKVEELALMNEKCKFFIGKHRQYSVENSLTREEKIAFIDSRENGMMSHIIQVSEAFEADRPNLPKDAWGNVKTVSLKAWLIRNDERKIFNTGYYHGRIYFLGCERFISDLNKKHTYDMYDDFVDETFHRVLIQLEAEERQYFKEHDEYEILKTEIREKSRNFSTTFGVHLSFCSDGTISVCDNDSDKSRHISLEEAKVLVGKYRELEKYLEELKLRVKIVY